MILAPLATRCGAGEPLLFSALYTRIQDARREDNALLSQGVWRTKIKLADWPQVIALCTQALCAESKDLQIIGWLIEAQIALEGIAGGVTGVQMLNAFCHEFWPVMYPNALSLHMEDGLLMENDDGFQPRLNAIDVATDAQNVAERRQNLLNWMDGVIADRLLLTDLCPATQDRPAIRLATWIEVADADKKTRGQISNTPPGAWATLDDLRQQLVAIQGKNLLDLYQQIGAFQSELTEMNALIHQYEYMDGRYFSQATQRLEAIAKILSSILAKPEMNENNSGLQQGLYSGREQETEDLTNPNFVDYNGHNYSDATVAPLENSNKHARNQENSSYSASPGSERQQIFSELQLLSQRLKTIDPHNPVTHLLGLLLQWQNDSMIQIMDDANNGDTEAHKLLRLIVKTAVT